MEYNIRIAKVRELTATNNINRWELMRYADSRITVSLTSRFVPFPDKGQITLVMGTCYYSTRNLLRHKLLCYNIEILFDVSPFPSVFPEADTGIALHPRLMTLMYATAIGALRGMLALKVEGTFLKDYPLPLINVSALVSQRLYGTPTDEDVLPLVDFVYN